MDHSLHPPKTKQNVLRKGAYAQRLRIAVGLLGVLTAGATAGLGFLLDFNLAAAGSVELLLVVMVALRWGFLQATLVSVAAVVCLNFFFTAPLFTFTVADPQNWISLATFEGVSLVVSWLSSKVKMQTARAERERLQASKLYELSRAILLIDGQRSTAGQITDLIRELLAVERVALYAAQDTGPTRMVQSGLAYDAYRAGTDSDDVENRASKRLLRLGARPIGAMVLAGWEVDALLADAVASLAAVALERAHALEKENRAEAARNTEQLRSAVLDGLAHGFKTPLTAIQTASSGLLAIGHLTGTQNELVSLIDERAHMLGQMTTRLLRTAALETKAVKLRRAKVSPASLLAEVLDDEEQTTRERVSVLTHEPLEEINVDGELAKLALLQLVDNAAKYSTVGTPIEVRISQDAGETRFVVANQGTTVRPEEREKIFERFYRGTDVLHGPTGTGLGLSIVKKTAEAHGGRAWVESNGDATLFFFTMARYGGVRHG